MTGWGFAVSSGMVALGTVVSGIEQAKKGKNEPRQTLWFIFGTYFVGLPVSPSLSPVSPSLSLPKSFVQ